MKRLYRAWFYFRMGYSLYIAFPLGFISTVIVVYSLSIKPVIDSNRATPSAFGNILQIVFPHLVNFLVIGAIVLVPICIYFGLYHMKKTGAYEADASVTVEQNPYIYKAAPGKEQEVMFPLLMLTAQGLAKMLEQQNSITPEERHRFEQAIQKAEILIKGEAVGPKK